MRHDGIVVMQRDCSPAKYTASPPEIADSGKEAVRVYHNLLRVRGSRYMLWSICSHCRLLEARARKVRIMCVCVRERERERERESVRESVCVSCVCVCV